MECEEMTQINHISLDSFIFFSPPIPNHCWDLTDHYKHIYVSLLLGRPCSKTMLYSQSEWSFKTVHDIVLLPWFKIFNDLPLLLIQNPNSVLGVQGCVCSSSCPLSTYFSSMSPHHSQCCIHIGHLYLPSSSQAGDPTCNEPAGRKER